MTDLEWATWTAHHRVLFAMRTDADLEMVASWRPILGHLSAEDLTQASDGLLAAGGAPYGQHVAWLRKAIATQAKNAQSRRSGFECDDRQFKCDICLEDRGLVDVPHPECIVNGELVAANFGSCHRYATIVVYCSCNKGAFKHQRAREAADEAKLKGRHHLGLPCMLQWYEMNVCANWRVLMEDYREIQKTKYAALLTSSRRRGPIGAMR